MHCSCGKPLCTESDRKFGLCFACKIKGIQLPRYSNCLNEQLYGEGLTNREIETRQLQEARAAGIEPVRA